MAIWIPTRLEKSESGETAGKIQHIINNPRKMCGFECSTSSNYKVIHFHIPCGYNNSCCSFNLVDVDFLEVTTQAAEHLKTNMHEG